MQMYVLVFMLLPLKEIENGKRQIRELFAKMKCCPDVYGDIFLQDSARQL